MAPSLRHPYVPSVALLSHRGGNIGHDFMAFGAEEVVRAAFGQDVKVRHFEQHRPFEIYPAGHWLQAAAGLSGSALEAIKQAASTTLQDKLWDTALPLHFDLAVACGGPNLRPGAHSVADMRFLMHHMNGAFHHQGVPLIDAGVGSCFPLEKPIELGPADVQFYRTMLSYSSLTTARDTVAQQIFHRLDHPAPLVPCMAIASGRTFARLPGFAGAGDEYIVMNIQPRGANEDWGQGVDVQRWLSTVAHVVKALSRDHKIVFLAHAPPELQTAEIIAPDLPRILPTSPDEYARVLAGAKVGLVTRIHAAIPLAGVGVPSLVVGTDSRLRAVEQMGLPTAFAKTVTPDALLQGLTRLIEARAAERDRLVALREDTIKQYVRIFREHAGV